MNPSSNAQPTSVTSLDGTLIAFTTRNTLALSLALLVGSILLVRPLAQFIAQYRRHAEESSVPVISPSKGFGLFTWSRKLYFVKNSQQVLQQAKLKYNGEPFAVMTDIGETIVLSSKYVNSVRNEERLSFPEGLADDYHASIPGFEPFATASRKDRLGQDVIIKQLTRSLTKITEPLAEEAHFAIERIFGTSTEWHAVTVYSSVLDTIARMSSRIFLGTRVCRDETWVNITKDYTVAVFIAAATLRLMPAWMRGLVHWFHPQCRQIRDYAARARRFITPIIEERKQLREEAVRNGKPVPWFDDAIDWVEAVSNGRSYDAAELQLSIALAALHTTSDLLTETLLRLARMPKLVHELREEMRLALRDEGWKKPALNKMTLLDSVVKETQRLKPIGLGLMERKATAEFRLSDGILIPKGARTICLTDGNYDPEVYPNPYQFDGHRFQKLRGTPVEQAAHLVSTGPASLGFGHGKHACPGRFFAAAEIKIALCTLLLNYDLKITEGATAEPTPWAYAFSLLVDHSAKVLVRKRTDAELEKDQTKTLWSDL